MHVNKTNPSFGMAFKFKEQSLRNADPSEIKKVADVLNPIREQLSEVTKYVRCDATACVKDGKITNVLILSLADANPRVIPGFCKDVIMAKLTGNKDYLNYAKGIEMKDFNSDTVLNAAKETSENALKRFGSVKKAEELLKS